MKREWFRAKERGNGWGKPITWEGWTISIIYVAFLVISFIWIDQGKTYESDTLTYFVPVLSVTTVVFFFILFLTGEKTDWHRPGKKRHHK